MFGEKNFLSNSKECGFVLFVVIFFMKQRRVDLKNENSIFCLVSLLFISFLQIISNEKEMNEIFFINILFKNIKWIFVFNFYFAIFKKVSFSLKVQFRIAWEKRVFPWNVRKLGDLPEKLGKKDGKAIDSFWKQCHCFAKCTESFI